MPITDVAQVEYSLEDDAGRKQPTGAAHGHAGLDLSTRIHKYYTLAAPTLRHTTNKRRSGIHQTVSVGGPGPSDESPSERSPVPPTANDHCFLLVPASESGKRYGDQAQEVLPDLQLVKVPGQADLMFCREQEELSLEDLERILHACRPAYDEAANVPQSSPHARFDIQDWMPLDP